MRNLIAFISKYAYFFLFLLFEVFSFYFLLTNNHFQRSAFLDFSQSVSGRLYESYSSFTDYLHLAEENRQLQEENRRLRENQLQAHQKLFGLNKLINDTIYQQKYFYVEASVINNSVNKQNNFLTLNVGELNGVERGMGVIAPNGVVGVVKSVSDHYALVLSLLHSYAKISSKLKGTNYFGSMQWDGKNYREAILKDIPGHVQIKAGDTIITSGYSAIFPEGIPVATIKEFTRPKGENFYFIRLKLVNDFKKLSKVYVIKNNQKLEQKKVEEKQEEND